VIKKIKENLGEILFFLSFAGILFIISVTPNYDVEALKKQQRVQYLKDSFEIEYYKKELESYPYDHSKIPTDDTIKRNGKSPKSLWR
jgi:hypothetical protein